MSEPTRLGTGEALFDFLAECIHDFVQKYGLSETPLPLGFTFSFPMEQKALDVGILVTWTKSFNCPGVVGTDAALQLTQAMKRQGKLKVASRSTGFFWLAKGNYCAVSFGLPRKKYIQYTAIPPCFFTLRNNYFLPLFLRVSVYIMHRLYVLLFHQVEVVAIMNDTTGTLVRGAYDDPRTAIGLILGTGCNGAYLERSERVIRWGDSEQKADDKEVIVDPEFGAFGDNGCLDFIKTKVDKEVRDNTFISLMSNSEKNPPINVCLIIVRVVVAATSTTATVWWL